MNAFSRCLRCILFVCLAGAARGQAVPYNTQTDTFRITIENRYSLNAILLDGGPVIIRLRGAVLPPGAFSMLPGELTFSLSDSLAYSLFDTLFVTYRAVPLTLKKHYRNMELVRLQDAPGTPPAFTVSLPDQPLTADAIFGRGLQKSGSIIRGFTIGSNKDLTLQSGLRLQLSGKLSDEIELTAALTDENSPIQPEGNTEKLEELDKVFIQIRHPLASVVFGDYDLTARNGEFGGITRKLQGVTVEYRDSTLDASFAFAASKGKFHTLLLNGADGVQGPYQLTGRDNERDIIIIAGSERVYLNGALLKRGEMNDYTVDYSIAQITFTPLRLISNASRITVEYEYTDRRFKRSALGGGAGSRLFGGAVAISARVYQEGDDQNAPIDISLSAEDKKLIAAAGSDRNLAVRSGVSLAQPDSSGIVRGNYIRVDTLINGSPDTVFVYAPGDTAARYNVLFSFVGDAGGDYVRERLGAFRFAGKALGQYLPVVFLPLPELRQFGNLVLELRPVDGLTATGEFAVSLHNRNRFSSISGTTASAAARLFSLAYASDSLAVLGVPLGRVSFRYKDRVTGAGFTSPDRIDAVEFNRNYDISAAGSPLQALREITLSASPRQAFGLRMAYGSLKQGASVASNRLAGGIAFTGRTVTADYSLDYTRNRNPLTSNGWLKHKLSGSAAVGVFDLLLSGEAETKKEEITVSGGLSSGSFSFYEAAPGIRWRIARGTSLAYAYYLREDKRPLAGTLLRESGSAGSRIEAEYAAGTSASGTLLLATRAKSYAAAFAGGQNTNTKSIVVRTINRFNLMQRTAAGELFYEASTQKTAALERVFVKVQKGVGNYRYRGDVNGNGIADEFEYEPALFDGEFILITLPSDKLYPVIDLKAGTRLKFEPGRLLNPASIAGTLLGAISTETVWRIEENSREEGLGKIYLMNFRYFRSDSNTIRGSDFFQQDIWLFENDPGLSCRGRFEQRKSLNQFAGGAEKGYFREQGLRLRIKMIDEIGLQADIMQRTDELNAPPASNRNRLLNGNDAVAELSYRPVREMEFALKIRAARFTDRYPVNPTVADINVLALRYTIAFSGSGRIRGEIERGELIVAAAGNYLPYELTGGYDQGKNYTVRVDVDYRLSLNVQSVASYEGRSFGGRAFIHTARAEVRAFF